jgi:hypothetical protein
MKTIILAAAAALVLSTGAALAGDGDNESYNQPFTAWAGLNNVPAQSKTMIATNPSANQTYVTQSRSGFHDFSVHQDS